MTDGDFFREELKRRRLAAGLSKRALSLKAKLNETAVKAIESGKSENPRVDTLAQLAEALGCSVSDLTSKPSHQPPPIDQPPANSDLDFVNQIPLEMGRKDLPVYGSVRGGFDREAVDIEHPVEWTFRPPDLVGVRDAFGMYVVGDCQEPRYFQGEIVWVHPGRPATKGAFVVIVFNNNTATLKRLVRINDDFVEVSQLSPKKTMRYKRGDIANIFRVIGSTEGH